MSDPAADDSILETQRRFIGSFLAAVPHMKALGVRYRDHGPTWAELEMPYAPHLVAYPETGVIASGAIFSLMDNCAGFAVAMRMREYRRHATLDLRCDYLRPATPQRTVIGRAECIRMTRRVAFVRGIAHDGEPDHPIAHVSGTFMLAGEG
ncbi:MAG: PaaI family thioesterase [Sphingomonadaceae bacterium]